MENEYNEIEEVLEPGDGDYAIEPSGYLGSELSVGVFNGKHIGTFKHGKKLAYEYAYEAIRLDMKKNNYYPNVWEYSDHGNLSLVTDLWDGVK